VIEQRIQCAITKITNTRSGATRSSSSCGLDSVSTLTSVTVMLLQSEPLSVALVDSVSLTPALPFAAAVTACSKDDKQQLADTGGRVKWTREKSRESLPAIPRESICPHGYNRSPNAHCTTSIINQSIKNLKHAICRPK